MLAYAFALLLAPSAHAWNFAVSGDSRDCGDVVMPAIAASALQDGASFYWHLGDLRRIYDVDQDIVHQPERLAHPLTKDEYYGMAWDDFIENQLKPFGKMTVYVGIGNHETIKPMTREAFDAKFWPWRPGGRRSPSYYAWDQGPVAFIYLDNATPDQFDAAQLRWFETTLKRDEAAPQIKTIVVGMHEALPESISSGHSMNESAAGRESGKRVYMDLFAAKRAGKRVYVLASHSHLYMNNVFNTEYWRSRDAVLPGWIVGTAGAQRIPLPEGSSQADEAKPYVYGYLLADVKDDGRIAFKFRQLAEKDIPTAVVKRYGGAFVHWCFAENKYTAP